MAHDAPAPQYEGFLAQHPALAAVIITLAIGGAFLGAILQSAKGHHGHGAAHGAPAGSGSAAASATASAAAH